MSSTYSSHNSTSALVSIIVPAYNREHLIGETLDSIREQTYQNWECLVINDGSTDKTEEAVKQYARMDPRFRCIRRRNGGPAKARNTGLKKARGQFVQFWDSDDLLEPQKIESHVGYLESHPEVDIVYGNARYFRTETPDERLYTMRVEPDTPWMPETSGVGTPMVKALITINIMVVEAPLFRRSVFETVGYFDTRLPPLEDWDLLIRCATGGKRFQYLDQAETRALIRWHPASLTSETRRVRKALLGLRQKIAATIDDEELLKINKELTPANPELTTDEKIQEAVTEVRQGKRMKAARLFAGIARESADKREQVKFLFCALTTIIAPRATFKNVVVTRPAIETIAGILRYYFRAS